ncbi:hypothetical protein PLA107_000320 [Pseudomonas amygdali pv. lachrymans str. M301315]|uniref:Uncharacterized protein n=1 Tax=Pseudomonas amygdali pv. lachrymans str. M301315 TaxID=629260 RepID=A0AAD0LTP2_PSEAV|nr:hypothetical protein PLA107_000320 [Pseudomonas amygdali pv. lachrymans str. M301315]PWD00373.1 hypothetical protein CX658_20395 [Pseudomonas amygdali pv. lachrymans]
MIFTRVLALNAKNYSLSIGFKRLKILGCCFRRRIASRHPSPLCDAERHERHANAEHWHDSHRPDIDRSSRVRNDQCRATNAGNR